MRCDAQCNKYVKNNAKAVGLDKKEQALSALEPCLRSHDLQIGFVDIDPYYDPLRSEPRFQGLLVLHA